MFLKKLFQPVNNLVHGVKKSFNSAGHSVSKTFHSIGSGFKDAGNWSVHAVEDTFKFGKNTISSVGNFAENQFDKVIGTLNNPTLLIVVGVAIVAIVILK